jgi:hypothetical protein
MKDPFFHGNVNTYQNLRVGRFFVSNQLLREVLNTASATQKVDGDWIGLLLQAMGKMVILAASYNSRCDVVDYLAISSLFEPLAAGAQVPLYDITINEAESGPPIISAVTRA